MDRFKRNKFLKEAFEGFAAKLAYYADVSNILQAVNKVLQDRIQRLLQDFSKRMNESEENKGIFSHLYAESGYQQEYGDLPTFNRTLNERIMEAFRRAGIDVSFLVDLNISPVEFLKFVVELANELEDLEEDQSIPKDRVRTFVGVYVEKYQLVHKEVYYQLGDLIVKRWVTVSVVRKAAFIAKEMPECQVVRVVQEGLEENIEAGWLVLNKDTDDVREYRLEFHRPITAEQLERMANRAILDKSHKPNVSFGPINQVLAHRGEKPFVEPKIVDITDEDDNDKNDASKRG